MTQSIKFVEGPPPPMRRGAKTWRIAVVDALKARPGEWAHVETQPHSSAAASWTKKGCEAVVRKNSDGAHDVYARWPITTPTPTNQKAETS